MRTFNAGLLVVLVMVLIGIAAFTVAGVLH